MVKAVAEEVVALVVQESDRETIGLAEMDGIINRGAARTGIGARRISGTTTTTSLLQLLVEARALIERMLIRLLLRLWGRWWMPL